MRLPEVGTTALDQRHFSATLAAERIAQAGDQFKAAGTTTDDDDLGYV
jgi:hypothetical protein